MSSRGPYLVELIFLLSCASTIFLILRRPYLRFRTRQRRLRLETYFLGALLGPVLLLALGLLNFHQAVDSSRGPLGILALFLSMVFISIFLDITGFFEWCARRALRAAAGDGRRLFFALYGTVALLTVFTSNDIIILTFTPFVCAIARQGRISPVPYLMAEFFAANTWSMMLYIGNPTNILIASVFSLDFLEYTRWMFLPTLAAGVVNAGGLYLVFHRNIRRPVVTAPVAPTAAITDRSGAVLGVILFGGCVLGLAAAPRLGIRIWAVALFFALALLGVLVVRRSWVRLHRLDPTLKGGVGLRATLQRMPWPIVPFILSLFITVGALRHYGVTAGVGRRAENIFGSRPVPLVFVYGSASALAANLLNNIPMTLAFVSVMEGLSGPTLLAAALATTIGSNLGANLTPLGALAGIMWMSILRWKRVRLGFLRFIGYGLLITPFSLAAALLALAAEFAFF